MSILKKMELTLLRKKMEKKIIINYYYSTFYAKRFIIQEQINDWKANIYALLYKLTKRPKEREFQIINKPIFAFSQYLFIYYLKVKVIYFRYDKHDFWQLYDLFNP